MGSSSTKPSEADNIEQIKSINENYLDLKKIDTLQVKAIKQLVKKIEDMEKRNQIESCKSYLLKIHVLPH